MLTKGQKINDRYEIIKSIGEGGMANVYLANDIILNRNVAVKVLRGDLSTDEKFIRRFQREALSASNLSHPNIVEVYDVGEEDSKYYIVMEYIEGKTLKQLANKRKNGLTVPEVIDIMSQLTDGLAHAHDAYIIHRDIKPQNILILDNGLVKITDFGIAMATNASSLTQTNSIMGSVHYLPPEQANGKGSTIKSDIYSLGILMFELLTGNVPFKGENAVEIALKHMKEPIPSVKKINPMVPQSIENIVLKATAKNPKNRYNDVREMYDDLKVALEKTDVKRYVYPYPETDLEETKVMKDLKKDIIEIEEKSNEKEVVKIEKVDNLDKKDKRQNLVIFILSCVFFGLLIIFGTVFLISNNMTKQSEVTIPDVSLMTPIEAENALKSAGFTVVEETEKQNSDKVESGKVINTYPEIGKSRKKGTEILIIESIGTAHIEIEDFTDKNYVEVKTILEEVNGLHVLIEKKEVSDVDKYRDKANNIIDQNPKAGTKLVKGDTITLYIPDIVEQYPDMVAEGWDLNDARAFEEKYGIVLNVEYKETNDYPEGTIISQNRTAGSTIIKGTSLKIVIAAKPIEVTPTVPGENLPEE